MMKGYKALNKDMTAYGGFKYEVGKIYCMDGEIKPCERGFHFCKSIADCYRFYDMNDNTVICEVEAWGEIKTDDDIKFVTNEIMLIALVEGEERNGNSGAQNSGYCNTGDRNTGNWNTGDWNTGDWNTGYRNTGDWNTGDWNTGNWNTGYRNTGNWNTGDWNTGNWNTGCFCTERDTKIKLFDILSEWTIHDWQASKARFVLSYCPMTHVNYVDDKAIVVEVTDDDRQKWWDDLSEADKKACFDLPNFDADKFCKCVGIKHI